jgi:hypothetical protein
MSKLALFLLVLCIIGALAEDRVFQRKLKHRRLSAKEILKQRERLPNAGKLFQLGLPFDYIFEVISAGTPEVEFEISVETGYNKLFLLDPTYPSLTPFNEVYDPNNSTTSTSYNLYDYGFSGVNTLEGWRFTDNVNILNQPFKQTFNTITDVYTVNNTKPPFDFSGVLGLAWDPSELINPVSQDSSPFITLTDALGVKKILTIWQERDSFPDGTVSETSMSFGSATLETCDDDLQYFPITSYASYAGLNFKVDGFKFGSYSKKGQWTGQLDTGSSIIYVPSAIEDRISRLITPTFNDDLYLYTTDCSKADSLEDWIFTIGEAQFNLPASEYIIDILLDNGQCVVAFGYFSGFTPEFVFGQPLLRQYCSVYDAENNQVGLSTAIHYNSLRRRNNYNNCILKQAIKI